MRLFRTDRRGNPILWYQRNKRPSRRHPHLPQLFYLVKNRNWPKVIERARTHTHEICVQEEASGNTPLHIAVRLNPPSEAVNALREAAYVTNIERAIPLHIAATHRCSPQVIRVLLLQDDDDEDFHPAACLTRTGRSPIHYACFSFRGLSLPAFQVLLEATLKTGNLQLQNDLEDLMEDDEYSQFDEPEAAPPLNVMTLRDSTGQTPLGLLFRRYRERVRIVINSMERLHPIAAAIRVQADLGELWEKARWIVSRLAQEAKSQNGHPNSIAGCDSPGEQAIAQEAAKWACEQFFPHKIRNFRIVHASVSLTGYGCPPEMIRLALSIHPHQAKEMDEDGSLPIHICAMAPSLVYNDPLRNDDDSASFSIISELSLLSHTTGPPTPNPFDKVLKILLQHYPAAARVPHGVSGKLPLLLAMERRLWEDGICALVDCYPAAIESKKWFPVGLYPYIITRIAKRSSRRRALTSVFEMLKAKPDLLKMEQS